ncbi:hypothetical protein KAW96_08720 [candidate division WOR-3 bacterium]|nr:hypothetical protein [candidate division WOR-3 bacterium]
MSRERVAVVSCPERSRRVSQRVVALDEFAFNIGIIIVASVGYKEERSRGWLLIIIYGFINVLLSIPSTASSFAVRFIPVVTFGKIMYGFSYATFLFQIAASVLLVVGLFFLLKEYLQLLKIKTVVENTE